MAFWKTVELDKYETWCMEEALDLLKGFWWPICFAVVLLNNLQWLVGRVGFWTNAGTCFAEVSIAYVVWEHRSSILSRPLVCAFIQMCGVCFGCAISANHGLQVEGQLYKHRIFLTSFIPMMLCSATIGYLPTRMFRGVLCPMYFAAWMWFHIKLNACDVAITAFGVFMVVLTIMVKARSDSSSRKRFEALCKLEGEQRFLDATQSCLSSLLSSQFLATFVCKQDGSILCSSPQLDSLLNQSGSADFCLFLDSPEEVRRLQNFLFDVFASKASCVQTIQVRLNADRATHVELYAVLLPFREGGTTWNTSEQGIFIGLQQRVRPDMPEPWASKELAPDPISKKETPVRLGTAKTPEDFESPSVVQSLPIGLYARRFSSKPKSAAGMLRPQQKIQSLTIDCSRAAEEMTIEKDSLSDYEDLKEIGKGRVGKVYSALRKSDSKRIVLKMHFREHWALAEQEYEILKNVEHPHIIRAMDFFTSGPKAMLALEYFDGETLDVAVQRAPKNMLLESIACPLFKALLQAVDYLHARRIIHRDIKPANVMLSHNFADLRLLDFNVSKCLAEGGALTMTGSSLFSGPEVLRGEPPSEANDVWACGLCLHIMLFGQMPWRGQPTPESLANHIASHPLHFNGKHQRISDPCEAVLRQCLTMDKRFRPSPITLLMHQWFWNGKRTAAGTSPIKRRLSKLGRFRSI